MDEKFLLNLIEEQSNGLIILNEDLVVVYVNKKIKEFFKSDINKLLGDFLQCNNTVLEGIICGKTTKCGCCIILNEIKATQKTNEPKIINNIKFNFKGRLLNLSLKISKIQEHIIIEFLDLSDLYEEICFLSKIMDKSKDIMLFKDNNLKYKYINKSGLQLFECSEDEIINKDDKDLLNENLIDKFLYNKLKKSDIYTLKNKQFSQQVFYKDRYLSISKEIIDDGILCIIRDVTEEINANTRAETDFLTNLYNRRKLSSDIEYILDNEKEGYYLAIIDLDNLKDLNNTYGHLKGDEYLSILGKILKNTSKSTFYRTGGDEFVGIIKSKKEEVIIMFDEIFKQLNDLNCDPPLTISAGISYIDTSKNYTQNYKKADELLYIVKGKGKNTYMLE